jgi:NADH-quinone oxidoreductase subunit C
MNEIFVAAGQWHEHHRKLKDQGYVRLEYITAVHLGGDEFKYVSLLSTADLRQQVLSVSEFQIASLVDLFAPAQFHEREIIQMFGVEIVGHENARPAFNVEFSGAPLRRDFALIDRVERSWPGAVEPDEAARRRPAAAPGVLKDWQS